MAPRSAIRQRCEDFADRLEHRPAVVLSIFILCYLLLLIVPVQRRLWHDELFTYYISQAPDIPALFSEIRRLDLNPPMVYAVTRGWQRLFGTNETVARIPSTIAFLTGSLGFVFFLRRRLGWLWACSAVMLFWASPSFIYATELRPYALLFMFFSVTVLSWDFVRTDRYRPFALAGTLVGGVAMMLCHAFAIFPLGAILLGELIRSMRRRQLDVAAWLCLLLPLGTIFSYLPGTQRFEASAFPARFQGGGRKLAIYFAKTAIGIAIPLVLAAVAAFAAAPIPSWRLDLRLKRLRPEEAGLWLGLLMIPVLLNGVLLYTGGAFFERYCLTSTFAITVTAVIAVAAVTRFSRFAALCALAAVTLTSLQVWLIKPATGSWHARPPLITDQIKSTLPFVAASGLTFLEMDHYERADFLSRVYYLTDRSSALQYAHATIFEGMPEIAKSFPLRANVCAYGEFVAANRRFLVLGDMNYPEDWLLRKLVREGATVTKIKTLPQLPYKDYDLYDVQVPEGSQALLQ